MKTEMSERGSKNVFLDLGSEKEEAASLKLRVDLMIELRNIIELRGLRQVEAAEIFGVSQPRISDLINRKIDKFSIDMLAIGSLNWTFL